MLTGLLLSSTLIKHMTICIKASCFFVSLIIIVGISTSPLAYSHSLKQTSAQIILRDGQVELRLYIERDRWLNQLQDHQAWLTGVNSVFITQDDLTSPDFEEKLAKAIISETTISLDGTTAQLTTTKTTNNPLSEHVIEFRFSARHTPSSLSIIETKFPESLGDVHLSISRPIYRNITQGNTASLSLK